MTMISVLVANAKGGCGKTTIATNLATVFANAGLRTAIADCDRQRSCQTWSKLRPANVPTIEVLDWRKSIGKPPSGTERLVIDTGAGLRSSHVQELLRRAHFLVMPVLPSVFDEKATRQFLKRVDELKPIRKGNKPVFVVGNRLRAKTRAETELQEFLASLGHEVAARFRDRSLYQDVARRGLGVFDLSPARRAGVVNDWLPLVRRIEALA